MSQNKRLKMRPIELKNWQMKNRKKRKKIDVSRPTQQQPKPQQPPPPLPAQVTTPSSAAAGGTVAPTPHDPTKFVTMSDNAGKQKKRAPLLLGQSEELEKTLTLYFPFIFTLFCSVFTLV